MILIFGGTTEGRLAIDVCEEAGKPFYYSTKGNLQNVELHNGVRLSGVMTKEDILAFCTEKGVSCIIDAAHPFAENLHRTIAETGLPVIRLQRPFGDKIEGCIYCKDYDDAITQMEKHGVHNLLALSGANTISRLKPFWLNHPTIFRILNREESIAIADRNGLPRENLIFYNENLRLPSVEEEKSVIESAFSLQSVCIETTRCDAIITKESGENGGFEAKVRAALELGLKVFVVEPPTPYSSLFTPHSSPSAQRFHYVTGKHTLRRAIQELVPDFFPLKTGLTTGACATAATKAALLSLLYDEWSEEVSFALPDGELLTIPVTIETKGRAFVIKDFSDDPDVLKGCKITSEVIPLNEEKFNTEPYIRFLHGEGVGTVTLPGLGVPVGEPAINPTPQKMIEAEINQVLSEYHGYFTPPKGGWGVRISVERGRELALKTFNPKVGVVDGISIIGTSGIVSPLSNEAFVKSIGRELEVAKAIGCTDIGIASGKKGEEALKEKYPEMRVIHYGNFIGETLKKAQELGFQKVVLGIMIGKAVKLAEGHLDTHSHKVAMNKEFLKSLAAPLRPTGTSPEGEDITNSLENIKMARELWGIMPPEFFEKIKELCYKHCKTVFPNGELEILLICDNQS